MKLSRRDFLHAGCLIAAVSLIPSIVDRAQARFPRGSTGTSTSSLSQRSIVNMNTLNEFDYAFINHYLQGDGSNGPFSSGFSTGTSFTALIDANGWPNNAAANGVSFGGSVRIPDPSNFAGPYVVTWQGSGRAQLDGTDKTWTATNQVTPGTGTITIASPAVISFANSFVAGQRIVLTTSGALPTGLSVNTVYFVLATGLSGTSFRVSATNGGAAINTTGSQSGTHTVNGTYGQNSNGTYTNSFDTINPYVLVTLALTGGNTGTQLCSVVFQLTDPNATGNYLKNFQFYRQSDETDLLAGKVFRQAFKQPFVNLCPAAIRGMNWIGSAFSTNCRFENRTLPSNGGYSADWVSSPVYASAVTGTNAYSSIAAVPTASNPKTTPTSMQHGEIATLRITNASVRNSGQISITGITNANPAQITAPAHGLSNGDQVVVLIKNSVADFVGSISGTTLTISVAGSGTVAVGEFLVGLGIAANTQIVSGSGTSWQVTPPQTIGSMQIFCQCMQPINNQLVTVANATTNTFTIGVDTTNMGTYTNTPGDGVQQYFSLQVGSGSDRTAYPIGYYDGSEFFGRYFNFNANNYYTFNFDKNQALITDGTYATFTGSVSGNTLTATNITGTIAVGQTVGGGTMAGAIKIVSGSGSTWTLSGSAQTVSSAAMKSIGWQYGVWVGITGPNAGLLPIEIFTALINELNAMGPAHPIGMWFNIAFRALNSLDPDYTSGSDYALNAVATILNGANGFAGLTALAPLYLEYSNECWNPGMAGTAYLAAREYQRWPGAGATDPIDMQLFLSTQIMRQIKAANPGTRIKYILGGWGDVGIGTFSGQVFGGNYERINGSSLQGNGGYYFGIDPVSSGWGVPITNYDAFATATYFGPGPNYCSGGTFAADSATYALGGSTNQNAAIASFVAAAKVSALDTAPNYTGYIDNFLNDSLTGTTLNFANAVKPYGKTAINYEGGTEWDTAVGGMLNGGHTITTADNLFLRAVVNSTQWRDAQVNYFNRTSLISNSAMPAVYIYIGQRWAYIYPDSYQGGVEGAAFTNSPIWTGMGTRNQALS